MAGGPKTPNMFDLQRNIRDCRIASSTDLLVLDKIAQRVNFDEKISCRPSYARIAEDTRLGESTVKASVRRLKAGGYFGVRHRFNTSNFYYLNYDFIADEAAAVREERKLAKERKDRAKWEADQIAAIAGPNTDTQVETGPTTLGRKKEYTFEEEDDGTLPEGFLSPGAR